MNDKFKIAKNVKDLILSLEDILVNYPKKYFELRNRLVYDTYNLLELVYTANYMRNEERRPIQIQALMKINLLDFYLEESYKKRIISERQLLKLSNKLLGINRIFLKKIKCKILIIFIIY